MDLSGMMEPTVHGEKYYMLLRDGYSHHAWVFLLKKKSDAFLAFQTWHKAIVKAVPYTLDGMHSDVGPEFVNERWLAYNAANGIKMTLSNVYTAEENGVAERGNRTTKEGASATFASAGLPPQYWGYLVEHSVACDAVLSSKSAPHGKSPYEAFFGRRPNVKNFRAPGTWGWVLTPKQIRRGGIHRPRAKKGRCLGLNKTGKGWVMLMDKGKITTSSNVVFWEEADDEESPAGWAPEWEDVLPSANIPPPPPSPPSSPAHDADLAPPDPAPAAEDEPNDEPEPAAPAAVRRSASPPPAPVAPRVAAVPRRSARLAPPPVPPTLRRSARTAPPPTRFPEPEREPVERDVFSPDPIDEDEEEPPLPPPSADAHVARSPLEWRVRALLAAKARGELVPRGRREAMNSPDRIKWVGAEAKEITGIRGKSVYRLVDRPLGGEEVIPSHFVYDIKRGPRGEVMYDENGSPLGQKARWVVDGNRQKKKELVNSYAPTATMESVRFVLGEAARPGWELHTADVKGAYLEADLPYDVFISIPVTEDPELEAARLAGKVCLLKKCLYGLVESGYYWSELLKSELVKIGYVPLNVDR
ncbi:hypothetical protein RQP46_004120 [Phenoliferia psychrophenolica]